MGFLMIDWFFTQYKKNLHYVINLNFFSYLEEKPPNRKKGNFIKRCSFENFG